MHINQLTASGGIVKVMKNLGLLATAVLTAGLSFILVRWPEGGRKTFSQRVAVEKRRVPYYVALFSVVSALLLTFFLGWFSPQFGLSPWFAVFIVISSATQYACTFIPEIGARRTQVHRTLAGVSAASLLPALTCVLWVSTIATSAKLAAVAGGAVMLATAYIALMSNEETDNFLAIQIVYYAAFFAPILYISYLM